jgi:hypothetical protein
MHQTRIKIALSITEEEAGLNMELHHADSQMTARGTGIDIRLLQTYFMLEKLL